MRYISYSYISFNFANDYLRETWPMLSCHSATGREKLRINLCFCCIKTDPIMEGTRQKIMDIDAVNADQGPLISIDWRLPGHLEPSTLRHGSAAVVRLGGIAGGGPK